MHCHLIYDKKGIYQTALIDAMENGHLTCVTALIEAGVDVNEKVSSTMQTTALHCHPVHLGPAFSENSENGYGHNQSIKLLIEAGADVNAIDQQGYGGKTPLHYAAQNSHHKCVDMLIQAGADVNHIDADGHTAVMKTTFNGRLKCLEILVQAGADVNRSDRYGKTPLHSLAVNGHDKCLKFLLESGADHTQSDCYGEMPLAFAASSKNHKCLDALIQAGADVNYVNNHGYTALTQASIYTMFISSVRCIKVLLKAGAHVNNTDKYGQNAIKLYITTHRVSKYVVHEGVMLLFAGGETVEGRKVERYHFSKDVLYRIDVPEYILELQKPFSLKEMCREIIRKKLIQINHPKNLFCIVPLLGLPSLLEAYLLYNMSLE